MDLKALILMQNTFYKKMLLMFHLNKIMILMFHINHNKIENKKMF